MSIEGRLLVTLTCSAGRIADVTIASSRPERVTSVLAGRRPADALRLVSMLFPVCGIAHGVACARAVERAAGRPRDLRIEAARDVLCLAEAAVGHTWQLALAWREASETPTRPAVVRAARQALALLATALVGSPDASAPLKALEAMAMAEAAIAIDALIAGVLTLAAEESSLMTAIEREGRASFGRSESAPQAPVDVDATGACLAADPAFAEHPLRDGHPLDLSAYARQRRADEVRRIEYRHGPGLLARFGARRADARADACRLAERFDDLVHGRVGPSIAPARAGEVLHEGAGGAPTARGPLVYWTRLDRTGDLIADARAVAPTDWTFHPSGTLREALVGAEVTKTLVRDVGWLVRALDPCVPWSLETRDA